MNYFVSIENNIYDRWQIELLIESFKIHDLEKSLFIYVADFSCEEIPKNCKNLLNHRNVFRHNHFGTKINESIALYDCIKNKNISYPFVFIQPSMILKTPIDKYNLEKDIVTNSYVEPNLYISEFLRENNIFDLNFSIPVIFNNDKLNIDFFEKLFINFKYVLDKTNFYFPCDVAAWKITLLEYYEKCSIGCNTLSCSLLHNNLDASFIDYNHGSPPDFNKRFFMYSNPYEVLLSINVSENCKYLHSVLNSYLKT